MALSQPSWCAAAITPAQAQPGPMKLGISPRSGARSRDEDYSMRVREEPPPPLPLGACGI